MLQAVCHRKIERWLDAATAVECPLSPRSGLSKGVFRLSKHRAFNPNSLARVMLLDSRQCTLNCRVFGIREGVIETSDIAALKLLKFCF
ncbi:hypothetical protein CNX70_14090 [Janthinobacterium svalbardensis]|uniref:Uncharacterized protein n=1 Tax=Janthinobacterium svalbardensis TaxID=368607 RepID=A0A290WWB0_9BURK|nr:hypothetical protein CNX70_14090 [Janthinobacterium svalbardensis]